METKQLRILVLSIFFTLFAKAYIKTAKKILLPISYKSINK